MERRRLAQRGLFDELETKPVRKRLSTTTRKRLSEHKPDDGKPRKSRAELAILVAEALNRWDFAYRKMADTGPYLKNLLSALADYNNRDR